MSEPIRHLTEEELAAWAAGTLPAAKAKELLMHTGTCDYCAERFAACLKQDLMEPPAYLREEILEKSRSMEVRTARTICQTSRQIRLFLYSLKVGLALAVSLLMLSAFPKAEGMEVRRETYFPGDPQKSITEKIKDGGDKMSALLENLAGWPTCMEYEEEQND